MRWLRMVASRLLLSAALAVCACAGQMTPVRPRQKVDPKSAYIYGRFILDTKDGASILGTEGVTFRIRCRDGETYSLKFRHDWPLQVLPLPASVCQIEDVIADPGTGTPNIGFVYGGLVGGALGSLLSDSGGTTMATFRLLKNEFLDPGGLYYVGDFKMTAKDNRKSGDRHNDWTIRLVNNYAATTTAMKRTYVQFASTNTEDRVGW